MSQSVRDEKLAKLKAAPKVPIPPRPPKQKLHEHSLTGEGVIEKFIKTLMEETGIVHRVTIREEVLRKLSEIAYEERLKKVMASNDEIIAPLNLKAWGERNDIQVMTPKDFPDRNSFRDAVFDQADAGITGADFAVAESGSLGLAFHKEQARLVSRGPHLLQYGKRGYEGPLPSMIRKYGSVARGLDGRIYLTGGKGRRLVDGFQKKDYLLSDSVDVYFPVEDRWEFLAPMHEARSDHASAVGLDGKLYVFGGCRCTRYTKMDPEGNPDKTLASVEAYDPKTNTWSPRAPMPEWRQLLKASRAPDGRIFVTGGAVDPYSSASSNHVDIYDPATDSWSAGPPLRLGRIGVTILQSQVVAATRSRQRMLEQGLADFYLNIHVRGVGLLAFDKIERRARRLRGVARAAPSLGGRRPAWGAGSVRAGGCRSV